MLFLRLRGRLIAEFCGAFNDNAWKLIVALLTIRAISSEGAIDRRGGVAGLSNVVVLGRPNRILVDLTSAPEDRLDCPRPVAYTRRHAPREPH